MAKRGNNWHSTLDHLVLVLVLIALVVLFGCNDRLTKEQAEWRAQVDAENWELCSKVYAAAHVPTIHRDHVHTDNGGVKYLNRKWATRQDLSDNNCRQVLGKYWINY